MNTKVDAAIEVVTSHTVAGVTGHIVEVTVSDIEDSIEEIAKSNKPPVSPTTAGHIGNLISVKFTTASLDVCRKCTGKRGRRTKGMWFTGK